MKRNTSNNEIKVTRAHAHKDQLFFDMEVNGVKIYGCRLVDGSKGVFVSFPSRKGNDGKYYSYAYVQLSEDDVKNIAEQIDAI